MENEGINWIAALGPSLLIVLGGLVTWLLKTRTEELKAIEEKLREERRKIYGEILDPYIRLFADIKGRAGTQQALKKITSYEYRKTAFELSLIGSDAVVTAYNNMVQYTFEVEAAGKNPDVRKLMRRWGRLLLEIRKSLGNKKTKLKENDILRGMIKDIDRLM